MTTQGFVVTHAKDAQFEKGLRSFFEYRDLGMKAATGGRVTASVIRAAGGQEFSSQPHFHKTQFQLVYVLKGGSSSSTKAKAWCAWRRVHACTSRPKFATANWGTATTSSCWRWCCPPTLTP